MRVTARQRRGTGCTSRCDDPSTLTVKATCVGLPAKTCTYGSVNGTGDWSCSSNIGPVTCDVAPRKAHGKGGVVPFDGSAQIVGAFLNGQPVAGGASASYPVFEGTGVTRRLPECRAAARSTRSSSG